MGDPLHNSLGGLSLITIRPDVRMYSAFARLNYKAWFALAEFVDNSIQSSLHDFTRLVEVDGAGYRLSVSIDIREDEIEICDNAGGIPSSEYARAFVPAAPPKDTTGLSEYGIGMKAAASWFAKSWSVRTKALGEPVERVIAFDVPDIVQNLRDELEVREVASTAEAHFTTLILKGLNNPIRGRTLGKVKAHLASIYRMYLRDHTLELAVNGERLTFDMPTFLRAPYFADLSSPQLEWSKEISLDLGDGHTVKGWAGILQRGSAANAGFAIFRRRRLIEGSQGESYRPEEILVPSL